MKILINLSTLKKGGGQNVGLNFLKALLIVNNHSRYDLHFIVSKNSQIAKFVKQKFSKNYTTVPNNPIFRILFELLLGQHLLKKNNIDIIYTIFGYGFYPRNVKQICGFAVSNIFFPEINFWVGLNYVDKIKKSLTDWFRLKTLKLADASIFENESMQKRSIELYNIKNTIFIKPSISIDLKDNKLESNIDFSSITGFKGLFLCGWQKNKNYELIPQLLKKFKDNRVDLKIIFTAPKDNSKEHVAFIKDLKKYNIEDRIIMPGQINHYELKNLYKNIDYVFLLSQLESFSNNIIESWYFRKLLIVSNEEWSRSICKEGACYVERNSIEDIYNKILSLINNSGKLTSILRNGDRNLKSYANVEEKVKNEINFVKYIYEKND